MASALVVESWTWYGLSWLVVIFRMFSRRALTGSFKKLQIDDGLMLLAMVTDTILIVAMNIVATKSSNLIDPNDPTDLTPENIKERIYGSKMVLVVEQMQIATIWLMKACLLIMYGRLTMSLKQNIAVKAVAVYVGIGFVVMEVLYLGVWCRPFEQYWAVPPNNPQCSAATNHLITNAALNISSDIMIILIPFPVLLQARLPLKKKAILIGVFALGMFTILSAILNKYYSFNEPFGSDWTFWYIRESSTAIITTNLPSTWHLFRVVFHLKSFNGKSSGARTSEATRYRSRGGYGGGYGNGRSALASRLTRSESQEEINRSYQIPLKIYQQQEIHVKTETVGPDKATTPNSDNISNNSSSDTVSDTGSVDITAARGRQPSLVAGGARGGELPLHDAKSGLVTTCTGV